MIRLYKPPLLGERKDEKKEERDRGKRRRGGEETFEICIT
jgi:hypothetical protein